MFNIEYIKRTFLFFLFVLTVMGWNTASFAGFDQKLRNQDIMSALYRVSEHQAYLLVAEADAESSSAPAQLVIDGTLATTNGLAPRINVFVPEITWADAAGNSQSTTINFSGSLHIPAPGTLALLGLAGLAGIRRRRR